MVIITIIIMVIIIIIIIITTPPQAILFYNKSISYCPHPTLAQFQKGLEQEADKVNVNIVFILTTIILAILKIKIIIIRFSWMTM